MVEVGCELPPLTKSPDRVQLVRYAGASGDFNPIHFDDEYARSVGLPGVIGHGMLTMGFAAELAGQLAGPGGRVEAIGVRFTSMVRPGDTLTIRGTVTAVMPPDRAEIAITVSNQRSEQVLNGIARVFLSR